MVPGIVRGHGGILGLVRFLEEHGEAVEYHLIEMGLRLRWLGTEVLTWADLLSIIRGASRASPIGRELGGASAEWGPNEYLLALVVDSLQWSNYLLQLQINPRSQPERPRPVSRPGAKPSGTRLGADPIPISQFEEWWSTH